MFKIIGNMSRHVKIVHCGIKAYNCTFCERSFGKAETLKHHIMTHTGEYNKYNSRYNQKDYFTHTQEKSRMVVMYAANDLYSLLHFKLI